MDAAGRWRTPKKRNRFLAELASGGNVTRAATAAGVSRSSVYEWRQQDAAFAAEWDGALEEAVDRLEEEATRRAMDGSDTLMIFLLKAHRPDKYRENAKIEHGGQVGLAVTYVNDWRGGDADGGDNGQSE